MTSYSIVRPAIPADRDEIWRLFRLHAEENALVPLAENKVDWYLDRMLYPRRIEADDTGPRGMVGVIGSPSALEAAIMLMLGAPWYSDEIMLDDCMNFVDPAHRKSDHAKALISYAKHLVDTVRQEHPSFRMTLGIVSTERTEAKIRLYSRQQLQPVGALFLYPPASGVKSLTETHWTD
jgi:GNAT superfamily N-acetyltransferase